MNDSLASLLKQAAQTITDALRRLQEIIQEMA
ncbi:hypothetical protein B1R32_11349 [Abditibacterium utsteinense]|uniref:Uncharacterized protein n=1 Tax=Abditibacterium utsteinense TaxID=1960156 RepID=A0A2S8SR78_9BACT|nr:hypothetical protein B1R32_11349 [Abditibacterium utsteinense]